jgi:hypothetical protein
MAMSDTVHQSDLQETTGRRSGAISVLGALALCTLSAVGESVLSQGSELGVLTIASLWLGGALGFYGVATLSASKRSVSLDAHSVFAGVAALVLFTGGAWLVDVLISVDHFWHF